MKIEDLQLVKRIFEAALMAAEKPLMRRDLVALFDDLEKPDDEVIDQAISELESDCEQRGYELKRVASGYRYQVRQDLSRWVSKMWQERAPRYSRALLETLSLVAYRQPITRGEIEEIRGVAVSTNIIKTLLEREWVKAVGHRDVPGRPAIYATTKQFLDYFNLKSLDQLPSLAEVRDLSAIGKELNIDVSLAELGLEDPAEETAAGEEADSGEETTPAVDSAQPERQEQNENQEQSAEPGQLENSPVPQEVAAFESWIDDGMESANSPEQIDSPEPINSPEPEAAANPAESEDAAGDDVLRNNAELGNTEEPLADTEYEMQAAPPKQQGDGSLEL